MQLPLHPLQGVFTWSARRIVGDFTPRLLYKAQAGVYHNLRPWCGVIWVDFFHFLLPSGALHALPGGATARHTGARREKPESVSHLEARASRCSSGLQKAELLLVQDKNRVRRTPFVRPPSNEHVTDDTVPVKILSPQPRSLAVVATPPEAERIGYGQHDGTRWAPMC